MDSPEPTPALPVHEFPQGFMLLGDWKTTHLAYLRGHTTQRRPLTQSVIHRMHRLHVSRLRWYKTTPSTFELASGSQWAAVPGMGTDDVGRVAQVPLPVQHQHHHLVAEVSLPISPAEEAVTPDNVPVAVQGYLRIGGNCAPALAELRRTPSSTNASRAFVDRHPSRLATSVTGLRNFGSPNLLSSPIAHPLDADADDSTPTRRNTQTSETTPTGPPKRVDVPSPLSAKTTELFDDSLNFQPHAGSSLMEEPDADMDESLDAVPARLDFSYLTKRSDSGSSSPFISPFASRSSSIASRSRASRGSTDSNRSQGTRSNSRSNSSNATSFSTSSGFSLSSAGLTFSDNPLNRVAGMASAGVETRFLVSYPGPQFPGLDAQEAPAMASSGDREECVLELSFPFSTSTSPEVDEPRGFLTLRDFTILADLVERSLKSENEDESLDSYEDDTSDSGSSDGSAETDLMDVDVPTISATSLPPLTATCCCEYFRRLFDVIPLVSGLRPTTIDGGSPESLSPLTNFMVLGSSDRAIQSHHELYSHHGRYMSPTAGGQSGGRAEETGRLRAVFERRRARHEEQLLQIVRPRYFYNTTTDMNSPSVSSYHASATVPFTALNEARLADERLSRAAEEIRHTTSKSKVDADQ